MKTTIRSIKTTLTLLGLMCTMHLAQAFYMAEAGRWINRDPIGERGGINLYGFTINSPVNVIDRLGLEGVSIGLPSGPGNNCYSYACNTSGGPTFPGSLMPLPPGTVTCHTVIAGITRDHPEADDTRLDACNDQCPTGQHKISVFVNSSNSDFHFNRQNSDGTWSHKPGFDGNPQYVFLPYYDPAHEIYCGQFCVKD